MLFTPDPAAAATVPPGGAYGSDAAPRDDLADETPAGETPAGETPAAETPAGEPQVSESPADGTGDVLTPDFETAPSRTAAGDGGSSAL